MSALGRCYGLRWTAKRGATCDRTATHDLNGLYGIPGFVLCCLCYAVVSERRSARRDPMEGPNPMDGLAASASL